MWTCPFCGRPDQRSREHVWPRWLRQYPAFEKLNDSYTGQRYRSTEQVVTRDSDDRYIEKSGPSRHVNSFLPHVQVGVCEPCNTGWMSHMEEAVMALLDKMIQGERINLDHNAQILLAAWAAKCWYAYASEWDHQNRPFAEAEYEELRTVSEPPGRALIWLGFSTAPLAYISEMVQPLFLTLPSTPTEHLVDAPPGAAGCYLAAHSVIFLAHWLPDDLATSGAWEEDIFDNRRREGLVRIWPPLTSLVSWPTPEITEGTLVDQVLFIDHLHQTLALPFRGLDQDQIERVAAEYLSGANPRDLRAREEEPDE